MRDAWKSKRFFESLLEEAVPIQITILFIWLVTFPTFTRYLLEFITFQYVCQVIHQAIFMFSISINRNGPSHPHISMSSSLHTESRVNVMKTTFAKSMKNCYFFSSSHICAQSSESLYVCICNHIKNILFTHKSFCCWCWLRKTENELCFICFMCVWVIYECLLCLCLYTYGWKKRIKWHAQFYFYYILRFSRIFPLYVHTVAK